MVDTEVLRHRKLERALKHFWGMKSSRTLEITIGLWDRRFLDQVPTMGMSMRISKICQRSFNCMTWIARTSLHNFTYPLIIKLIAYEPLSSHIILASMMPLAGHSKLNNHLFFKGLIAGAWQVHVYSVSFRYFPYFLHTAALLYFQSGKYKLFFERDQNCLGWPEVIGWKSPSCNLFILSKNLSEPPILLEFLAIIFRTCAIITRWSTFQKKKDWNRKFWSK
jgi:hypothetical protein